MGFYRIGQSLGYNIAPLGWNLASELPRGVILALMMLSDSRTVVPRDNVYHSD